MPGWLPGFAALSNAWYFLLAGPLLLFYFLKLRRPRYDVSSLALWRQVINDSRVNSPFQRFKRHLLLLLQLLLLILLVTAAMQPFRKGSAEQTERMALLIDCSASMAARDKPGGETRLALAVAQARKLVDGLLPGQQLCLIAFAASARRLTPFTADRRELRRALSTLTPEQTPANLTDALRMTRALARGAGFDRATLISDGNFPPQTSFALPFELAYHKLPAAGPNIGITELNARLSPEGGWRIFVQLEGSADATGGGELVLAVDGQTVQTEAVTLDDSRSRRLVFVAEGKQALTYTLRFEPDGFDALAADDTAHLSLPRARPLLVHLAGKLAVFRLALEHLPGVELISAEDADLVITDKEAGSQARTVLRVGQIPEPLKALVSIGDKSGGVVDWRRSAPLLQHVNLEELVLLRCPASSAGVRETDFERKGFQVLAHGTTGPLLLRRRSGGQLRYDMLFDPERTTLPYRIGFPVLVSNLVQLARRQAGLAEVTALHTGVLPAMQLVADTEYQVDGPDRLRHRARTGGQGWLAGVPAPAVGLYQLSGGGAKRTLGVSLLSTLETRLEQVEKIQFEDELTVAASERDVQADRPLWQLLTWLAFALMLFEWWYFQRRPRT